MCARANSSYSPLSLLYSFSYLSLDILLSSSLSVVLSALLSLSLQRSISRAVPLTFANCAHSSVSPPLSLSRPEAHFEWNAASLRLENPFLLLLLVKRESKIGLVKGLLSSRISPSSGYLKINLFYNSLSWDIFFHSGLCCYIVLMSNAGVKRKSSTIQRVFRISDAIRGHNTGKQKNRT